jgi:hypothetical protein
MIWAEAIAAYPHQLCMFHGLEVIAPCEYSKIRWNGMTIFDLGHREPVLRRAGLSSSDIGENVEFFNLSPAELHYLSCNCHGEVPNEMVADRMATLAAMKPGEYRECNPMPTTMPMPTGMVMSRDEVAVDYRRR